MLKDILEFNKEFVESESYKSYNTTNKYPMKRLAIVTCMDTRLIELLPASMGLKNGDVKIIKNAGGIISHPYGSVMRSLIVAIYSLGVDTIWIVGHTDCGVKHLDVDSLLDKMHKRGIDQTTIDAIRDEGIDYSHWLEGFDSSEEAVMSDVKLINEHPLIPHDIEVKGMIIDSITGELTVLEC
ncbi:MAG: carbonic anhydrase [Rikenellaceae bacterium]